jgi:HlyD family secretion protein
MENVVNVKIARTVMLAGAANAIAALLGWLATNQGPLAATKVTVAKVARGRLAADTFGIGTVAARRSYALGPTVASRVARVLVDQGDAVKADQLVAELDSVDLGDRLVSAQLAAERASSAIRAAEAQVAEARSRAVLAASSAQRYGKLRAQGFVSQETADARAHEANAAKSAVDAAAAQLASARRDRERALADAAGAGKLRAQMRLVSPVDGIVTARLAEPGTTLVAGQSVVQVIDPASLWVRVRIDQAQAGGVRAGQPADIVLRSDASRRHRGTVERVDWLSDTVTEERIVNVGFAAPPDALAIGELVEVTIRTADLPDARSVPAAALQRVDAHDGVWQIIAGRTSFRPVRVGVTTLDGRSEIVEGLDVGDEVIMHSERRLRPQAKVQVVSAIVRAAP